MRALFNKSASFNIEPIDFLFSFLSLYDDFHFSFIFAVKKKTICVSFFLFLKLYCKNKKVYFSCYFGVHYLLLC